MRALIKPMPPLKPAPTAAPTLAPAPTLDSPTMETDDIFEETGNALSGSGPPDRRFKLSRACDRCRRRRIRCDEGHPCKSCTKVHSECTFDVTATPSTSQSKTKKRHVLEERMRHLEALLDAVPRSVLEAVSAGQPPELINTGSMPAFAEQNVLATTSVTMHTGMPMPALPGFASPPPPPAASAPTSTFFVDSQGHTRWFGETSGLPLVDQLIEIHSPHSSVTRLEDTRLAAAQAQERVRVPFTSSDGSSSATTSPTDDEAPNLIWEMVTELIAPDVMEELVRDYLSTSYYLMPFLHLPTFLQDYENPRMWDDGGFASFIVAICCLSSLASNHPRVQDNERWFDLFNELRSLSGADRPTLYTIQAVLVGSAFALSRHKLSRGYALLAEAATLSLDAGLHRSAAAYAWFDSVQTQVRTRTFWAVFIADKLAAARSGRPALLRLRDCDVGLPAAVDDVFITRGGPGVQPAGVPSRMATFVSACELALVLEGILERAARTDAGGQGSFLAYAQTQLYGVDGGGDLQAEEALLDTVVDRIPAHWAYTPDTLESGNVMRMMQAERLQSLQLYIRLLIHRHRLAATIAERTAWQASAPKSAQEVDAARNVYFCASQLLAVHLAIGAHGRLSYRACYPRTPIHLIERSFADGQELARQLTQICRSLTVVFAESRADNQLAELLPFVLDNFRSALSLLRNFGARYTSARVSAELITEVCAVLQIPLDTTNMAYDRGQTLNWLSRIPRNRPAAPHAPHVGLMYQHGPEPLDLFVQHQQPTTHVEHFPPRRSTFSTAQEPTSASSFAGFSNLPHPGGGLGHRRGHSLDDLLIDDPHVTDEVHGAGLLTARPAVTRAHSSSGR